MVKRKYIAVDLIPSRVCQKRLTTKLGKNGMKITTISALIYESKLAL
jgi:hypothetical protein